MKGLSFLGLVFGSLGFLGFFSNLFTGYNLTQDSNRLPETHLSFALISTALSVLGIAMMIASSSALFRKMSLSGEVDDLPVIQTLRHKAILTSVGFILLILLTMITGTFSHSGRWPLLHSVIAMGIYTTSFTSLFFWIKSLVKLW